MSLGRVNCAHRRKPVSPVVVLWLISRHVFCLEDLLACQHLNNLLLYLCPAVVPPGYYLKGPGQVAPCPQGEWKSGIGADGNCTRCAMGVTTEGPAATSELNCTILVPGFYAKAMTGQVVTEVAICPQKYYCRWVAHTTPGLCACTLNQHIMHFINLTVLGHCVAVVV